MIMFIIIVIIVCSSGRSEAHSRRPRGGRHRQPPLRAALDSLRYHIVVIVCYSILQYGMFYYIIL